MVMPACGPASGMAPQVRQGKILASLRLSNDPICANGRPNRTIRYMQPAHHTARHAPTWYPELLTTHQAYRLYAVVRSDGYAADQQACVHAPLHAGDRDSVLQRASHRDRGSLVFLLFDDIHLMYFV